MDIDASASTWMWAESGSGRQSMAGIVKSWVSASNEKANGYNGRWMVKLGKW